MDSQDYFLLLSSLQELARQKKFGRELTYFDDFEEFYIHLDRNERYLLYHDPQHSYLEDLAANLKNLGNQYCDLTGTGSIGNETDIPYLRVEITEMLRVLASDELEQAKLTIKHGNDPTPYRTAARDVLNEILGAGDGKTSTSDSREPDYNEQLQQNIKLANAELLKNYQNKKT